MTVPADIGVDTVAPRSGDVAKYLGAEIHVLLVAPRSGDVAISQLDGTR